MKIPKELRTRLKQELSTDSKYKNKLKGCLLGHVHHSRAEADYCNRLLAEKEAGEIVSYDTQVHYSLHGFEGMPVCVHVVDFVVKRAKGPLEVHEVKGAVTDAWKLKARLFLQQYKGVEYFVITKQTMRVGTCWMRIPLDQYLSRRKTRKTVRRSLTK